MRQIKKKAIDTTPRFKILISSTTFFRKFYFDCYGKGHNLLFFETKYFSQKGIKQQNKKISIISML
jgi:hypothetical protein